MDKLIRTGEHSFKFFDETEKRWIDITEKNAAHYLLSMHMYNSRENPRIGQLLTWQLPITKIESVIYRETREGDDKS